MRARVRVGLTRGTGYHEEERACIHQRTHHDNRRRGGPGAAHIIPGA